MIYAFKEYRPVIHPTAFIHPQAAVTGHVIIGKDVYIGPGAALRGDWGCIVIGDGVNVQENCTIHMFPGITVVLQAGSHIGHGAIVHGAHIGPNCLIGMNSVIMDDAAIGEGSIVGALSLVRAGEKIPPRSLVAGSPARILGPVSDEMLKWKTEGTALYQSLPKDMHEHWSPCDPLREVPPGQHQDPTSGASDRPDQSGSQPPRTSGAQPYRPWKDTRNI